MLNNAKYFILFILFAFNSTQLFSEEPAGHPENIDETASIQEEIRWLKAESFLMEVSSVSKKTEKLFDSPAAIYVITKENIRRSGAASIPELLRMVPGLQVAQIDANKWAITSRGFNARFVTKLLVLIDGRTVYSPLLAGVYWDVQNYLMEDLERIEVIRGPGGTLWGANAINGVINIITKNSRDTQGGLLTGRVGNEERAIGGFRYGGKIGKDINYRFYSRYFKYDDSGDLLNDSSLNGNDKWNMLQGGFRLDWDLSSSSELMFQGNIYDGHSNESLINSSKPRRNSELSGGHVLGRWKYMLSDSSEIILQMYLDQTFRKNAITREVRNISDIDLQHRFKLGDRQEFMWGLGYRYVTDDIDGFRGLTYDTDNTSKSSSRYDNLLTSFVQDEITLIDDKLRLILGTKISHNDYTGLEFQPNLRLIWKPTHRTAVWASVSRSVRTPNRFEHDSVHSITTFPTGFVTTGTVQVLGSHDFHSENLIASELGYRIQPAKRLSIDIATFYNSYDALETTETGVRFPNPNNPTNTIFPTFVDNKMKGETYGVEISTDWNVTDRWKLYVGYTYLHMKLKLVKGSNSIGADIEHEGIKPNSQAQIRSYLDLPFKLEFDTSLYYVDNLDTGNIPSYFRLDTRLGWHGTDSLEMSVGMKNILDDQHPEFAAVNSIDATEVERSVYFNITWQF
ncbi:tonB-dependent receptor [Candidatus Scalindua japonica]|uniref:TonB-dependent receptor n=1 Tax=Candidatus Scalindua japonica TaxID=1284222 RepID=A0A286TYT3_9BACT|nr:TonB-dependent receptor [Candidatus Scalindua japonica]GAX60981.1 tonB-dependent receptor [Candidatus Scalindua japonica]